MWRRTLSAVFSGNFLLSLKVLWKSYFAGGHFSINGLDVKLEKYLPERNGYFIELGANDGATQSNTLYFERKKGWSGLLIEPTPEKFKLCAALRGGTSRVFCAACVPFEYDEKFVELEYSNLMTVSRDLELDIPDPDRHIAAGVEYLPVNEINYRFGAPARTLTSLLDEAKAPSVIDLISLDVEGAELAVLKGFDFSRYQFRFLLVECRDLPRVSSFLDSQGYRCIDQFSHHDHLFAPK